MLHYFMLVALLCFLPSTNMSAELSAVDELKGDHNVQERDRNRPTKFLTEQSWWSNGCACSHRNCACCEHLTVKKIHLNDTVCTNITYIAEDVGIRLSLSVDTHVFYSKEISVRNPPPVCFSVPHLHNYASLCIILYDLNASREDVTGCAKIEATLYHVRIAHKKIGCFRIPI